MKKLNKVALLMASAALLGGCSTMGSAPTGTRVTAADGGNRVDNWVNGNGELVWMNGTREVLSGVEGHREEPRLHGRQGREAACRRQQDRRRPREEPPRGNRSGRHAQLALRASRPARSPALPGFFIWDNASSMSEDTL